MVEELMAGSDLGREIQALQARGEITPVSMLLRTPLLDSNPGRAAPRFLT